MTREYEYGAGVQFICEYMSVFTEAWLMTHEYFDIDDAEDLVINHADEFISEHYGFNIRNFATVDIEVLWNKYPEDEDDYIEWQA
jgi:hypothetical protein